MSVAGREDECLTDENRKGELECLRTHVCGEDLRELRSHLGAQLDMDAGLAWRFAQLRKTMVDRVYIGAKTARKPRIGAALYEFNNIFALANPPYLESELSVCFTRVDELVQSGVHAISIYPKWDGCDAVEQFRSRVQAPNAGFVVVLEANRHAYFDYQEAKTVPARFASLGFALTSAAVDAPQEVALRAIFEALACADISKKRRHEAARATPLPSTQASTSQDAVQSSVRSHETKDSTVQTRIP